MDDETEFRREVAAELLTLRSLCSFLLADAIARVPSAERVMFLSDLLRAGVSPDRLTAADDFKAEAQADIVVRSRETLQEIATGLAEVFGVELPGD
jgi:predicted nucleotidyltransferase